MHIILVALAISTALLSGCGNAPATGLADSSWQLVGLALRDPTYRGVVPVVEQAGYTLSFDADGTFSGAAACNQISGTFTTSGSNGITLEPRQTTLAYCAADPFGALYARALGRSTTYARDSDGLTLRFESGGGLQFGPRATDSGGPATTATAPPTTPVASPPGVGPLTGPTWQLTTIDQDEPPFQDQVPEDQQANYTIAFGADGTVTAQADCNTLVGTWTTADPAAVSGELTLVGGASTLAACPEGSLADVYVAGLAGVSAYSVANDQLTLMRTNGSLVFRGFDR